MKTKTMVSRYLLKIDELNVFMREYLQSLSELDPEEVASKVFDYLIDSYIEGFAAAGYLLGDSSETVNSAKAHETVYLPVAGKTFEDRVLEYCADGDASGILLVANTDSHRVFNAGAYERGTLFQLKTSKPVTKSWITVCDWKVRGTHSYLHGESAPLADKFYTYDGDSAHFPGDFERVENNAECRCILSYSAA